MTENQTIEGPDFQHATLDDEYFQCVFKHCDFSNVFFPKMIFEQCRFNACNLSLCKMSSTSWNHVLFEDCKMTGITFPGSNRFTFSVSFSQCQLQHASFQGLNLQGTRFCNSQLAEADFSECNLKKVDFSGSRLERALFLHCNLEEADFCSATGYSIHPTENRMNKAKFAIQGLSGLLEGFGIEIVE